MDDTILDPEALDMISSVAAELEQSVTLELRVPRSATELGGRLEAFVEQIAGRTDAPEKLALQRADGGDGVPELVLSADGRCTVRYQAVPAGPELPPFVHALAALGGRAEEPPFATVDGPLCLDVFVSPDCPNCPRSVVAAVSVCTGNPRAMVRVIDATAFAELAVATGVRSVPMVVADSGLTVVGALDAEELADKLTAARASDGEGVVFGSLVDAGRFGEAAVLLSSPQARRVFVDRWRASALEGRIGLSLTADEALAGDPGALDAMVPDLLPLLAADSAPLRGDTAELVGKIGHPSARSALERLLDDDDEDVAEIAADAVEELAATGRST
jgi:hypothetical protein